MFRLSTCALLLQAGFLASCANSVAHFALEELGAESVNRTGESGVAYRSAIIMHGLSVPVAVGSTANVPGKNLPDMMTLPIHTGCSRIVEQQFDLLPYAQGKQTEDQALDAAVNRKLQEIDHIIIKETKKAQLNLDQALLSFADSQLNAPNDAQSKNQVALLLNLPQNYQASDLNLQQNTLNKATTVLAQQSDAQQEWSSMEASAFEIISDEETDQESNPSAQHNNILVLSWNQVEKSGFMAQLSALFQAAGASNKEKGGYLIVAGLRSSTLVPGDDFSTWLSLSATGSNAAFKNNFIVTHQLAAKRLAFREEAQISQILLGGLKIPFPELSQPLQELVLAQELKPRRPWHQPSKPAAKGRCSAPI